ncbi:glycerophosphodiester phosphodiesterase family protein [Parablautia muri]|uniref:Glycerophosphodiester phosphodiesterase n=1 Tax=Parablautia muri TaxID=2320879 RepID=A0A9X5GSW2_9FIRM|nr:glycerophosphodiester phosphodiesterase family protein [Parablautia muri]NBJ94418.1 glycerophosphodiester phosphodiesterase [Parablautia muri]
MVILFIILIAAVIVVLYFLAIMPALGNKKNREDFFGVFYAHRGLHDNNTEAPENSLAAFRKAVEAGYGMEMDVQITKDEVPVVFHDFTLKRICGKGGKVCDYTWEELKEFRLCASRETIPRFEEVLKLVGGKTPLIIELKVERTNLKTCTVVDALLKEYEGLYCIESFNPLVLMWYKKHHRDVVRGQLSDGFIKSGEFKGVLYHVLQNLMLNWLTKPDFVAYNHKYANVLARRLCHGLYKNLAVAWTIRSQQELERAEKGFDLFIFDSFIPNT